MRAKIMLWHFALQLLLLLQLVVDPIAVAAGLFELPKEMGSRSTMDLKNISVSQFDFRFAKTVGDDLLWKEKLKKSKKKRAVEENLWIKGEMIDDPNDRDFLRMHAFVVRDEDIPTECDTPADKVTKSRYFMCSGVILDENHVLTSASCVNQAHIHEYHIEADLAVLIGALEENSYVIKIAHYEIHPRYVPDPDSLLHATNNIALLRLACSIPRRYVVVPKLPTKRFEDVAHFCCSDRCKLSTVVGNSENQHFVRLMKLKHLPSPMHIYVSNSSVISKKRYMMNSNVLLNGQNDQEAIKEESNLEILRRITRQLIDDDAKKDNLTNFFKSSDKVEIKIPDNRNNQKKSSSKKSVNQSGQDDDSAIDWEKVKMEIYAAEVSEKHEKLLSNFVQNSMSDIMTKLLEVVTQHIADMNNVFSYFQDVLQEKILSRKDSNQKISDLIGRNILKYAFEKMTLISNSNVINCIKNCSECIMQENFNVKNHVDNKKPTAQDELHTSSDIEAGKDNKSGRRNNGESGIKANEVGQESDPVISDNVFCPPLGSPVIANKTLVGLIAYTCDDVQNWVEWKYVNIIHNIRWIRKELQRNLTEILENSHPPEK